MNYNESLKKIREKKGKTQNEIANELNTTQQQYWKYEKGIQELPVRHLITLSKIYQVTTDEILGLNKKTKLQKNESEEEFLDKFKMLSPKDKGRIIGRMEEILEKESDQNKYEIKQQNNGTATVTINNK